MITRITIALLTCWCTLSCAQSLDESFKKIELPLSGEKKYFGRRDLDFNSSPKPLQEGIVKLLSPQTKIEHKDSVFNMETGEFISVQKRKIQCFGFYKILLSDLGYFLIYSIADKDDEYGFNIYLNVYDLNNNLKDSQRIYSSSEFIPFRNFKLTDQSLSLVDYLPVKTEKLTNGKKKNLFTTDFKITRLSFDKKKLVFIEKSVQSKNGSAPPSKYKDAEIYLMDDPILTIQ
jgi:hypothetical protein